MSVAKESSALGAGYWNLLPRLGGALHFEKPPLLPWSTPMFLSHPSGGLIKTAKCWLNQEETAVKIYHAEKM